MLSMLTTVAPGVRNNDSTFVRTSFQNLAKVTKSDTIHNRYHPSFSSTTGSESTHFRGSDGEFHSSLYPPPSMLLSSRSVDSTDSDSHAGLSSMDLINDDGDDGATYAAAAAERAMFDPDMIDKLIAVLMNVGPEGVLGSQFPEAYRKLHGE